MAGLSSDEVYRPLRRVNVRPLLEALPSFGFVDTTKTTAWMTMQRYDVLDELLESLQLGGYNRRLFCRKLMPHQGIPLHTDDWVKTQGLEDLRRFQLPIVSHPDIVMRWPQDAVTAHLAVGTLYEVRFDRPHEVTNDTPYERIHVQIDQQWATV